MRRWDGRAGRSPKMKHFCWQHQRGLEGTRPFRKPRPYRPPLPLLGASPSFPSGISWKANSLSALFLLQRCLSCPQGHLRLHLPLQPAARAVGRCPGPRLCRWPAQSPCTLCRACSHARLRCCDLSCFAFTSRCHVKSSPGAMPLCMARRQGEDEDASSCSMSRQRSRVCRWDRTVPAPKD